MTFLFFNLQSCSARCVTCNSLQFFSIVIIDTVINRFASIFRHIGQFNVKIFELERSVQI